MAQPKTRFVFTWNNYDAVALEAVAKFAETECKYLIYGKETGDSGTPHLQGFFSLKKKQRVTGLKKKGMACHLDGARGTSEQAIEYCKKEGDYTEFGTPPSVTQGNRTDLTEVCDAIKSGQALNQVADAFPEQFVKYGRGLRDLKLALEQPYNHDDVRGLWIYGPPGTGKSHTARTLAPDAYLKPQSKWWDGYAGQHSVILADLDTHALGHYLKIWSDKYACTGETKGGTVHLQHRLFIVTSNYSPTQLFEDPLMAEAVERRFKVHYKDSQDYEITLGTEESRAPAMLIEPQP